MEITNKNTFTEEQVHFDRTEGLVYIGKSCYRIEDLERITVTFRVKDLNDSLNYRVKKYVEN